MKKLQLTTWQKNIYLYVWGTIINLVICVLFDPNIFLTVLFKLELRELGLILSTAIAGMSTSLILTFLDAILKEYANAAEVPITAIIQWFLWGEEVSIYLYISSPIVFYSLYLYNVVSFRQRQAENCVSNEDVEIKDTRTGEENQ